MRYWNPRGCSVHDVCRLWRTSSKCMCRPIAEAGEGIKDPLLKKLLGAVLCEKARDRISDAVEKIHMKAATAGDLKQVFKDTEMFPELFSAKEEVCRCEEVCAQGNG